MKQQRLYPPPRPRPLKERVREALAEDGGLALRNRARHQKRRAAQQRHLGRKAEQQAFEL